MPIIILIMLVLIALYIGPMLIIWAINYLFHTVIDYNFATWCAVMVLWLAIKLDLTS